MFSHDEFSVVFVIFQILFLLICTIQVLWGISRTNSFTNELQIIKSTFTYWCTITSCMFLTMIFSCVIIWNILMTFYTSGSEYLNYDFMLEVVQCIVWLMMGVFVGISKLKGEKIYWPLLRLWWISNSLFVGILAYFAGKRIISNDHKKMGVFIDNLVWIISFPVTLYMSAVAVSGKTGIFLEIPSIDLSEYLIPKDKLYEELERELTSFANASWWSILSFSWVSPLLKLGSQSTIQPSDVPSLRQCDTAFLIYNDFSEKWKLHLSQRSRDSFKQKGGLLVVLWKTFNSEVLFTGSLIAIKSIIVFAGPVLLNSFVECIGGKEKFAGERFVLVLLLLGSYSIQISSSHQYNFRVSLWGLHLSSALNGVIFDKILKLSSIGRQNHTAGEIINFMSTDVQRLSTLVQDVHNLWALPLQIIVALIILFKVVGVSMFSGLVVMILLMLVNLPIASRQAKCISKVLESKDKRLKITTDSFNNMKTIKMYAWQHYFLERIQSSRIEEYGWLKAYVYTVAVNIFMLWLSPYVVSVSTFGLMLYLHMPLTPGKVFTAIATFRILQEPIRNFPRVISSCIQSMVSLNRIQNFLMEEELQADAVNWIESEQACSFAVKVENGCFAWDKDPVLKEISLQFPKGSFVAVCGSVGSGKTSLLSSILGEMNKLSGQVYVCGSTAFASQTAWIQNGTIQDNILFGKPMLDHRYGEVLRCCSLLRDLASFPKGDETEIGERGLNLSGGQKQRIQLARAVYHDADIYLFDDPFSAVDAITGSEIFKECILEMLKEKTVILVTHQVDFLPAASLILTMHDGKIVESGKYDNLLTPGSHFDRLVASHFQSMDTIDKAKSEIKTRLINTNLQLNNVSSAEISTDSLPANALSPTNQPITTDKQTENTQSFDLIQEEERESGQVSKVVYWNYLSRVLRGRLIPVVLLVQLMWQALQIASDFWLAEFSSGVLKVDSVFFFKIYSALAISSAVLVLFRTTIISFSGLIATQSFFNDMLISVFNASMVFFDSTPVGRILSRVSSDQASLDLDLPFKFGSILAMFFSLFGILCVTVFVTWPVVFAILPLPFLFLFLQKYYLKTSRELTRLNGLTKAPIIANVSESITGALTIRAFKNENLFIQRNYNRLDENNKMRMHYSACNEWLGVILESSASLVLCFSAFFLVTLPPSFVTPSTAGLSLSYGLQLSTSLFYLVWAVCELENTMVSVERISQFSNLPKEGEGEEGEGKEYKKMISFVPSPQWPFKGEIEFLNVDLRYRDKAPLVLKNISFLIRGGEKVGIVGRTGSGKSSLIQALFRMVEICAGRISIDDVDVRQISLHHLRHSLSIIPQDPTLFEGSLRENLDPMNEYSDEEIWQGLEKCQMADVIKKDEKKLFMNVSENGSNWSVGQKQLFCLCRALLKKRKLLVCDEATASVDSITDVLLQKIIRSNFENCTLLTIAHRIPTVVDSERVMVLQKGELMELDSPSNLLSKKSIFKQLVEEYASRSQEKGACDS